MGILHKVYMAFLNLAIIAWDWTMFFANIVLPKRPVGKVVPQGHAGAGGKWPEYVPRKEGDSRSSCPALNAMANHGILPHDGKNITFTELNQAVRATYNFAPSFCLFVPHFVADYLSKDYAKDTFSLHEIDKHNAIEHDGSLTRDDVYHVSDQSQICVPFVEGLLASATGKDAHGAPLLLPKDLSAYSGKRRADARATNPEYTTSLAHRMFGSSNSCTMLTLFGGIIADLRVFLLEERLQDGWEPKTVLQVELGVKEPKVQPGALLTGEVQTYGTQL
ncbi:Cloroperoxidase [Athelia psychrophila]|uniref:Cloroperoxidase n=1 Tax=Athelia psychrophila TaxID=1759441 RepID=A0A167WH95_9AGAM|nr:Cloroperoxidase [Fibularhizoctonia sp. CBS 109695]